ncbi:MAG: hypothetical protein NXI24_22180 [bacterium]|nr:hypothetical protein [bacterium]
MIRLISISLAVTLSFLCAQCMHAQGPQPNTPDTVSKSEGKSRKSPAYSPADSVATDDQVAVRRLHEDCSKRQRECIESYCQSWLAITQILSREDRTSCELRCRAEHSCSGVYSDMQIEQTERQLDCPGCTPASIID